LFPSGLLIKAARHIFITSSGTSSTSTSIRPANTTNAIPDKIDSVTVPSIAYIATFVRYALSGDLFMDMGDTARTTPVFDYCVFHNNIVALLSHEKMKAHTADLVAFWNENLFPADAQGDVDYSTATEILAGL
ncbi:hypothetical protein FRC03_007700, partial [Tulasnella sp. 419]